MITAERVNGIVRFQANGLPVVSLYCRVDPGASRREDRESRELTVKVIVYADLERLEAIRGRMPG